MKFWELASAFRSEQEIIVGVLKQDKWKKYLDCYIRIEEIVKRQQRDILDEELPFELCYEVAEKSKQEFWLSYEERPLILRSYRHDDQRVERLLPAEVLVRFGGNKIEEALEYGSAIVHAVKLNGAIEVIASYNLSHLGLLSVMRTEHGKLAEGVVIGTAERLTTWEVKSEASMMVSPYQAYEKFEAQNKQHIYHYFLHSIGHDKKPLPGTILVVLSTLAG